MKRGATIIKPDGTFWKVSAELDEVKRAPIGSPKGSRGAEEGSWRNSGKNDWAGPHLNTGHSGVTGASRGLEFNSFCFLVVLFFFRQGSSG